MPAVHLTMHAKSSTLYGRTVVRSYGHKSKFFWLDGLLQFCIIMGLRSVGSVIIFLQQRWHIMMIVRVDMGQGENRQII